MKFFVSLMLTALVSFAGGLFFPWWCIAVAAFIVALFIHQRATASFLAAFLGSFLLWFIQALYIDLQNQHLLSSRVAQLFPLGGSYIAVIILTAFIGGLVAGMAAMTASYARKNL